MSSLAMFFSLSPRGVHALLNKKRSSLWQLPAEALEHLTSLCSAPAEGRGRHWHPSPVDPVSDHSSCCQGTTGHKSLGNDSSCTAPLICSYHRPCSSLCYLDGWLDHWSTVWFGVEGMLNIPYLPGSSNSSKFPVKPPTLPVWTQNFKYQKRIGLVVLRCLHRAVCSDWPVFILRSK